MASPRKGFTLIEVMAVLIISATVAIIGIRHLQQPGDLAHDRSCQLARELLQHYVQAYIDDTGSAPSSSMREIATDVYAGRTLPTCPVTGRAFQLDRNGRVRCADHPE
ncbi:competence type IV pilus major pilin ComGC [Novipirellula sp.]|uniref:competence type IV pilus major pilin ComGC n=1 Tax=Novipirellula sp. TaxID=2795430 RepID=UPI00356875A8